MYCRILCHSHSYKLQCKYLVVHNILAETNNIQVLRPYLQQMMEGVLTVSTQYSSEVLALCLETVCSLITVS